MKRAPTAKDDEWQITRPLLRRLMGYRDRLRGNGQFTIAEVRDEMEVPERTFHRDRAFTRTLGWDLEYCRRRRAWTSPRGHLPLPGVTLTEDEGMALLAAEPALAGFGGKVLSDAVRAALRKISAALDAPLADLPVRLGFELHTVRETDPAHFRRFNRASGRQETLQLTYHTAETGTTTVRLVDPYILFNHEGTWYAACYCHTREAVRDFALTTTRVKGIEETGQTFERQPGWDFETYRRQGFGIFKGGEPEEIVLRFGKQQALYQQERTPFAGEERELLEDGRLLVRFSAPVQMALKRWVLQFGADVEVLSPPSLRQRVQEEARKVLGMGPGLDAG